MLDCNRIVVKVFGSLVTGLALPSSDMDMAITGLQITDRTTLIEDLHNLEQALNEWDLVQDLKSIDTASIPVIKANIDLRKIRKLLKEQSGNKEEEFEDSNEEEILLPIDITFDDSHPDSNASLGG